MLASYSLALSMGLHSQIKVPNIKLLYGKSVKGRPLEASRNTVATSGS
jgi:hypothetical protein